MRSLAALAAELGDGTYRADAAAAAVLAAASAQAAAHLVAVNLTVKEGDRRLVRARASAEQAAAAAARALDSRDDRCLMSTMAIALSDAELVQRCRAGDLDAWNQLVERFSRYVYAICTQGFRLPQSDAEDVFQEVFTRVYTRSTRCATTAPCARGSDSSRGVCAWTRSRRPVGCSPRAHRARRSERTLDEVEEAFVVREGSRQSSSLPGDARPLLRSRRELSDDLERARSPVWHDRQPHLRRLRQPGQQLEGKK